MSELRVLIDLSFKMASCRPDDSDDSIRVYTTDTIVDNPKAKIVYKGLIICASNTLYYTKRNPKILAKMAEDFWPKLADDLDAKAMGKKLRANSDILAMMKEEDEEKTRKLNNNSGVLASLTEEAKEKAKKLNANAIVGMKIAETFSSKYNQLEVSFIGTAVHVSKEKSYKDTCLPAYSDTC